MVRNGFTCDLADMLVKDIRRHLDWFASQPGPNATLDNAQFHHYIDSGRTLTVVAFKYLG